MKKRNEQLNQPQAEERRPVRSPGKGQESAADFALHLAAMFRAELGEEDDQLDPLLNWELPASEEDYREAAAAPEDDGELFRAVADFLEEETGQKAPAALREAEADTPAREPGSRRQTAREAGPVRGNSESVRRDQMQRREARSEPERSRKHREEPEQSRKHREEPERSRKHREEPERSHKHREEPEQSRKHREDPERARRNEPERQASRKEEAARQAAPGEAPAESAAPASERVVFFEPKQKKSSFFDTLQDPERTVPAASPSEERPVRSTAETPPAAGGRESGPRTGREAEGRAEAHERQSPRRSREASDRRQTKADRSRRHTPAARETRASRQSEPAARETRASRQSEPTGRHGDRSDLFREISLPASLFQQLSEPAKEAEPLVLPGFDDTPFQPPQEDPSLEELFAPLGLKAAPPDPDTAAVLTPRVQEREAPEALVPEADAPEADAFDADTFDIDAPDALLFDAAPAAPPVPDAPKADTEAPQTDAEAPRRGGSYPEGEPPAAPDDAAAPVPDAPLNDTEAIGAETEPARQAPEGRRPAAPAPRRAKKQSWLQKLFSGENRQREPARRDPPSQAPAAPEPKPASLPEARRDSPRITPVPTDSFDEAEVLAAMEREIPGLAALLESSEPEARPLPEPAVPEPDTSEPAEEAPNTLEPAEEAPDPSEPAEAEVPEKPLVLAAPIPAAPANETPEAPLTHAGPVPEAAEPLPAPVFTVPEAILSDLPRQSSEAASDEDPLTHTEIPAPEPEIPAALRIHFEEHAPEPPVREEPAEWISRVYVPEDRAEAPAEAAPQAPADSPASVDRSPAEPEEAWSDDRLFAAIDALLEQPLFGAPISAGQDDEAPDEADSVPYTPTPDDIAASVDPVSGSASEPRSAGSPEPSVSSRRSRDALSVPELFDLFGLRRDPPDKAPDKGQQEADDPDAPEADAEDPRRDGSYREGEPPTAPDTAAVPAPDADAFDADALDALLFDTVPTVESGGPDAPEADAEAPRRDGSYREGEPPAAPDDAAVPDPALLSPREEALPALSLSFEELNLTPEAPMEEVQFIGVETAEPSVEENLVPELWDPLSLFSEAAEEPPQLTPLPRNTTGKLPSLEELFGPAPEAATKAEEPAARPRREQPAKAPRRKKKPNWLQRLFGAVSGKAAGGRQQTALSDQQTAVSDHQSPVTSHQSPELPFGSADNLSASPDAPLNESELPFGSADNLSASPDALLNDAEKTDPSAPLRSAQDDSPVSDSVPDAPLPDAEAPAPDVPLNDPEPPVEGGVPDAPLFDAGTPVPDPAPLRLGMDGFLASLGLREPEDLPAADNSEAPELPLPSENSPPDSESAAEDWDPLALFGGVEDDSKLPTWEEYLRSRREAPAPTPEEIPDPKSEEAPAPTPEESAEAPQTAEAPWAPPPADPTPEAQAPGPVFPSADEPSVPEPPLRGGASDIDPDPPLEALFGPVPEAAPEPEPLTVPMDLAEPEPAAEESIAPKKLRGQRKRNREALSLKDFLAAAVPMEETQPPRPEPRKQDAALRSANADTISTARENPEGLILTWTDREEAPRGGEEPPAAPKPELRRPGRNGEPVPSADVRREEPPRKAPKPAAPLRKEPAPDAPQPPEEKSPLHPEEAYRIYARPLDEIGSRLVLTGLFTLLSLFFTLYMTQHWTFLPEIFSGGTTVYILLGLLGLMVLVNRKLYFREWRDAYGLRAELLLGIATLFTALDCFPAAQELRPPFPVVVGALLMVALWGRYDRGLALISTVKVLREEPLSAGVSEVQDITKGSRGLIRTKPDVDSFMSKLETRDLTQRVLRIYSPAAAIAGLLLTLLISIGLRKPPLWTGALIFLGSVPVTGLLAFSRLFCLLANRLSGAQAALCGYHGAEVFGGEHFILIGDDDVFPAGSLTLNGFKVYNGNPDRMIAYAAAAFRSSGSALDPVFEDLLVTHNGRHYTVDNFRFYDSGGIGASIMQDVVLLGSLDFMRRMGVHMDKGARVKQAVYMSLNGELAAVFAVRYTPPENLRRGLAAIAGNRHFKGILVTRTFLGTPGFLKVKFGIPTGAFHYPSTKERIRLSEAEMKKSGAQGAILAKDSFSGFAQAAAGGRLLRSATLGAAILTVLGGLIGLVLMGVLAALHAYETATALNLLLCTAAWLAPTLLLTAWARHF